jgi:hypothetical protein
VYICETDYSISSIVTYDLILPRCFIVSLGIHNKQKTTLGSLYGTAPEVSGVVSICAWRLYCVVLAGGVQRRYGSGIKEAYNRFLGRFRYR